MRKISAFLAALACAVLFGGCWDKHEVEDNTFAILMGIDTAEDEAVTVTIAFPVTQTESGGLDAGSGGGDYRVMSVKAPSIAEGIKLLGAELSGPLALYSVKTVVIAQEIAESDRLRQIFSSWRSGEIRGTTGVLISQGDAAGFIEARIAHSPIDPLRQEELLLERVGGGAQGRPTLFRVFLANLQSDSGDGVALYGGVAPGDRDSEEQEGKEGESGGEMDAPVREGYLPGELPLSAKNESRIAGLAVFRGAKMVGVLDSLEAQTYAMLTGGGAKTTLTVSDPFDPERELTVEISSAGNNKAGSAVQGGVPVFDLTIPLRYTIECAQSGIDYTLPQNSEVLTAHIGAICLSHMEELVAKSQREFDADILRLGEKLARHFRTVEEWENYDWPQRYREAEIRLHLALQIEYVGAAAH